MHSRGAAATRVIPSWTPFLIKGRDIFYRDDYENLSESEKRTVLADLPEYDPKGSDFAEFLYFNVNKNGNWVWGRSGTANAAFLHGEALAFFRKALLNVPCERASGARADNYRPDEMAFLMELTRALKSKAVPERRHILTDYDAFVAWIDTVHREGSRQFRHMLRYFAFPDRVERISSNNNRRRILDAFGVAPRAETRNWSDQQLDDALFKLRGELLKTHLGKPFDFYDSEVKERWATDRKIKTPEGEVTVVVPGDEEEEEEGEQPAATATKPPEARQSIQTQGKLAEIGVIMGFKIWVPGADRARVLEFVPANVRHAFLETLPLNTNEATLDTIKQIDVLWLRRGSIVRAFEVEHTTAVYSGLLRMADLLALQPNMDIRLHIVAPDERRDKVFREMARPVFMLLERGPLSDSCTFISYESVDAIRSLKHLAHTNDGVLADYEERAETSLA
jgi:hypothetical protein